MNSWAELVYTSMMNLSSW